MWTAVRALDDRAALLKRMATRAGTAGRERLASSFERQAEEALERASTIRDAIERSVDDLSAAAEA